MHNKALMCIGYGSWDRNCSFGTNSRQKCKQRFYFSLSPCEHFERKKPGQGRGAVGGVVWMMDREEILVKNENELLVFEPATDSLSIVLVICIDVCT